MGQFATLQKKKKKKSLMIVCGHNLSQNRQCVFSIWPVDMFDH